MMPCNISSLPFYREVGYNRRSLSCFQETEFITRFHQYRMKDIHCLNVNKYVAPGEITENEVPPYAVEFCTAPGNEELFAVADEDGVITILHATDGKKLHTNSDHTLKPSLRFHAHNNAIFDIAWVPHENFLCTASGDQTAVLWDVPKREVVVVFKGHSCSLKSINVSKHNTNLLVTGSRDGNALVWDKRSPQPTIRIQDAHVIKDSLTPMRKRRRTSTTDSGQLGIDSKQTVSCALFQDSNTIITSGAMDNTLKLWDIRKTRQTKKNSARHKISPVGTIPYPGASSRRRGYTCLTLDSSNTHLYASCTDDTVYHFNLATMVNAEDRKPLCVYKGHNNTSFYIRTALSPGNKFLLSGSDDKKAYIWMADAQTASPIVRLASEEMSEVTAVAWCPYDITKLVTCSDECVVRVWNLPLTGMENLKSSDIDGQAEVIEIDNEDENIGGHFTTVEVKKIPAPESPLARSSGLSNPLQRELFTPGKTRTTVTPPSSAQKTSTTLQDLSNSITKTPSSLEKWIVRSSTHTKSTSTNSNGTKSRAVKCLHMNAASTHQNKENQRTKDCLRDGANVVNKNWLAELSQRHRSKSIDTSPNAKRQKIAPSSPNSTPSSDKTPMKQTKTLDSYFNSPS